MRKSTTAKEIELMLRATLFLPSLFFSLIVFLLGLNDSAAQHAHEHGSGRLNIAIEELGAIIEFFAPAESIYGFEHAAQSKQDKQAQQAALRRLEQHIHQMILFEEDRACQFSTTRLEVTGEAQSAHLEGHAHNEHNEHDEKGHAHRPAHAEVQAEFTVTCQRALAGTTARFGVTSIFPRLPRLSVQVLSDTKQTGATITNDEGSVDL